MLFEKRIEDVADIIKDEDDVFDEAIKAKIRELDPTDADAYCSRGIAYMEKGKYNKAITDYTEALKINPKYADAYYNRGNAYVKKGLHDKAIEDFNKAIELKTKLF